VVECFSFFKGVLTVFRREGRTLPCCLWKFLVHSNYYKLIDKKAQLDDNMQAKTCFQLRFEKNDKNKSLYTE